MLHDFYVLRFVNVLIYTIHFEGRAGEGREEGLGLAYKMNFSFKI